MRGTRFVGVVGRGRRRCPILLGRNDFTMGQGAGPWYRVGAGTLGDPAEVVMTDGADLYRYSRADMTLIESWNSDLGTSHGPNAVAMDVANDTLWGVESGGALHYMTPVEDGASAVPVSGVNIGSGTLDSIVFSPYDGELYRVYQDDPTYELQHLDQSTGLDTTIDSFSNSGSTVFANLPMVATSDGGLWWTNPTNPGVAATHILYYDLGSSVSGVVTGVKDPDNYALAATDDGRVVFQSNESGKPLASLSIAEALASAAPTIIDCPDLNVADTSLLQCGSQHSHAPLAVMSHYIGYDGDPDRDFIWEWPG